MYKNKEEVSLKINEVQQKLRNLRRRNILNRGELFGEWNNICDVTERDLFPLIVWISTAIKKSSDVEEVKELHKLFHRCYQILIEDSNYGRNRLIAFLSQGKSFSQDEDFPTGSGMVREEICYPEFLLLKYRIQDGGASGFMISLREEFEILKGIQLLDRWRV